MFKVLLKNIKNLSTNHIWFFRLVSSRLDYWVFFMVEQLCCAQWAWKKNLFYILFDFYKLISIFSMIFFLIQLSFVLLKNYKNLSVCELKTRKLVFPFLLPWCIVLWSLTLLVFVLTNLNLFKACILIVKINFALCLVMSMVYKIIMLICDYWKASE